MDTGSDKHDEASAHSVISGALCPILPGGIVKGNQVGGGGGVVRKGVCTKTHPAHNNIITYNNRNIHDRRRTTELLQEFESSSSDPPQAIEREEVGEDRLHYVH
jgi:hypothetical protein